MCTLCNYIPGEEAVDVVGSEVSQTTDTGDGDYKVRCPCGCNEVRTWFILYINT